MQAAAVQADLGHRIARVAAARLAVDELAEAVEEDALEVLDALRLQLGLQPERGEFAHGVGQQRDPDADLLQVGHGFVDVAGDALGVQVQREREAADAAADDGDAGGGILCWHANDYPLPAGEAQWTPTSTMKSSAPSPQKKSMNLARLYARPGFLLRRAQQISAAVFEDACRDLDLTPAQFGILTVLQEHPGMGQSSLARALGFDKVTVLRVLRGLQARGLVTREPSDDNRRNVSVNLTSEGEVLLRQAQKPAEQAYRRLMAPLDKQQQAQLIELLQLLTGELEEEARAAFVPPPAPATRQAA